MNSSPLVIFPSVFALAACAIAACAIDPVQSAHDPKNAEFEGTVGSPDISISDFNGAYKLTVEMLTEGSGATGPTVFNAVATIQEGVLEIYPCSIQFSSITHNGVGTVTPSIPNERLRALPVVSSSLALHSHSEEPGSLTGSYVSMNKPAKLVMGTSKQDPFQIDFENSGNGFQNIVGAGTVGALAVAVELKFQIHANIKNNKLIPDINRSTMSATADTFSCSCFVGGPLRSAFQKFVTNIKSYHAISLERLADVPASNENICEDVGVE